MAPRALQELGGFKFLERFTVDARLPDTTFTSASRPHSNDNIDALFQSMNLPKSGSATSKSTTTDPSTGIKVIHSGGKVAPQSSIIEIKTRSSRSQYQVEDSFPQLFFSQTAHLFLGRHDRGRFYEIIQHDLADLDQEKARFSRDLKKVTALLREVRKVMLEVGRSKRLSLVYSGKMLTLYEHEGGLEMPEKMKAYFE